MKTMIRSFASALVAVMTLGLVQTAQAEIYYIGDPVVYPEGACEVKGCPSEAEENSRVEFTLSNFATGVQVANVKVMPSYWYEPFDAFYDYDKECWYFEMPNDNVYLEVNCEKPTTEYSITYNASPEVGGKVEGGPTSATAGTVIGFTVAATNEAYAIDSVTAVWGSGTVDVKGGEGGYYWFDMPEGAVTVSATFVKAITGASISGCPESAVVGDSFQLAVNVEPSGEGVESYTTTWSSSNAAVATIDENGKVSVVGPGKVEFYAFVTGQRSGAELAAGVTCTAEAKKYSITIPKFDHGMVTSNVAATNEGATVTLTVTPDAGYELDTIKVDGIDPEKGEGSTYTFEMPNHDVEVAATFKEATKYSITTVADPEGTCLFDVIPELLKAAEGEYVEFHLNPASGATINSLTVYKTDDPDTTITYETYKKNGEEWHGFNMRGYDVTIKVKMESEAKYYSINIPEFKGGTVTSNVASTNEGATVTLTVTPDAGYELDNITVDGLEPTKGEGSTYTFEMPNHDVEVQATFKEAAKYKINTSVTPSGACEVHVEDSAQSGEEVYFEVGNFAAGATLGSLAVWNMSVGTQVKVEQAGKGYTFMMPDGDVLIQVFCSDPEPPKDPEILDVTAQQRYPWNGLVDIGYTVTGTVPDGYVLKVSAMDMKTYDTFDAKTITAEEFPLSEGTHKLKWDMNADGYTTEVSDSIFFMVSAESSAGASFGATSSTVKLDLRTGTTREIALGATETLTYSTDYEGGPTPPVQEGVQLWENGPYFAETNIGAKNPQDYGYYFWWGDTVGYQYSDMAWTAVDGSGKVITFDDNAPANSTYGLDLAALIDNKWIDETSHNLVPEHDAATAHLDKPWRMPTSAEIETLCSDVCDWKAVTDDDGNLIGYMVSGKEAYAGNSIFLPAAGIGEGSDILHLGESGGYWSSTPHTSNSELATAIDFKSWYYSSSDLIRFIGRPIRPVRSATASAAANGASNEGETVTITVNGKTLKSGLIESGKVDWTPTEPGEYVLNHIVNSADGSTEITNLVARYNVAGPTTTVAVIPVAADNTSVGGVYTNGIAIASTAEGTYIVDLNATVDVVFDAAAGYFFKKDGAYTPVMTNTTTAAADPTEIFGPGPNQGTQVGTSAYAFVDGDTCTIVGSGAADTRLSTVVSPGAITSVVIQPGITEVGARFFKDFKWLNAVTGGQDLKTVGEKAFYKCFSLETIDLDCTAVPEGMDESVVYQTALKSDGSTYQIPEISVKNHVKMLFGKKSLDDADWTCLGPSEGKSIYEQDGYQFFQIRLVPDTGSKE